jgi:hypothetical protein
MRLLADLPFTNDTGKPAFPNQAPSGETKRYYTTVEDIQSTHRPGGIVRARTA